MPIAQHRGRIWQAAPWVMLLLTCAFCLTPSVGLAQTYGSCTVSATNIDLGTVSSLVMAQQHQQSAGEAGIACSSLSLLSPSYIKVLLPTQTLQLVGGPDNQSVPLSVHATDTDPAIPSGHEVDFSESNLLNLFGGPGNTLRLHFRANAIEGLRAGTYTGTVRMRWSYSICSLGLLGVCSYSNSPGATRNILGTLTSWGSGVEVTQTVTLQVQNDCSIHAPALDFGTAPLAGSFSAVNRTISIRCSAGTEYSVGLSNGNHFAGGSRRMRRGASGDYLRYEIFRDASSQNRWGELAGERRSSTTADLNPGVYDGNVQQDFTYRAQIDPAQDTPAAGLYTDSIVLDIEF